VTPEFWQIIEETKNEDGDRAVQAQVLSDRLGGAGLDTVLDFSRAFDAAMDHLYSWELWGAAFLAMGGCSDDMFEYLRAWLIADGQATAMLAGSVPELAVQALLGETDDPDARWGQLRVHDGERIVYAAGVAHERLTGEWLPPSSGHRASQPSGTPWDEDDLPHLYPDLAAVLPTDWWGETTEPSPAADVLNLARRGIGAFSDGDHALPWKCSSPCWMTRPDGPSSPNWGPIGEPMLLTQWESTDCCEATSRAQQPHCAWFSTTSTISLMSVAPWLRSSWHAASSTLQPTWSTRPWRHPLREGIIRQARLSPRGSGRRKSESNC
jgi:hypothetical protein